MLNISAMIDELFDRDARGHFGKSAEMIAVPMSRNQVIDLRDARVFRGRQDAPRVTSSRISCVDEYGLARRRHEERRVAALHVHHVDLKWLRGLALRRDKCW